MTAMPGEERHPSRDQIQAVVFGWKRQPTGQAERIRAHATACPACRPLLEADEEVHRLLARLPGYERAPGEDAVAAVFHRFERAGRGGPRVPVRLVPVAVAALVVFLLAGTALLAPGTLEAARQWLRAVVVRELPGLGQPGAPPATVGTSAAGARGPVRSVSLAEARRLVAFPVALPRWVPEGFTLAEVRVFQPNASVPPRQVFLTYRRPGALQPLVLTYQATGAPVEVAAPPGAVRELVVAGQRAVYVDAAAEGLRPLQEDGGAVLQVGRLVVERPDVVLTVSGDRRDGLDVDALIAVTASIL